MAIPEDQLAAEAFKRLLARGDDSPPLMTLVPEPPPSHWGKVTSQSRTLSAAYMKFLGRKEQADDTRRD